MLPKTEVSMHSKNCRWILIAVLLLVVKGVNGQSAPAASGSVLHLSGGAEFSGFDTDVTHEQPFEYGVGGYGDLNLWRGVGIEGEARTIQFNEQYNVRQDILSGGLRYAYVKPALFGHQLIPYGKGLVGLGSADFPRGTYKEASLRQHDTFTVMTLGGGVDYALTHRVFIRAEYEYQFWFDYGRGQLLPGFGTANPHGFSIGAAYRFF
jgi:opacity protein-like surface antigen